MAIKEKAVKVKLTGGKVVGTIDDEEEMSFNKFQRICDDHLQDEVSKVCFCGITGKNCRKDSCPKEEEEES